MTTARKRRGTFWGSRRRVYRTEARRAAGELRRLISLFEPFYDAGRELRSWETPDKSSRLDDLDRLVRMRTLAESTAGRMTRLAEALSADVSRMQKGAAR